MQWSLLARTELRLWLTSRGIWALCLTILASGLLLSNPQTAVREVLGPTAVVAGFGSPVTTFGGLGALAVSYRAVSYELDSGRIHLIGSLPFQRRDIILGKFVGRTAAVAIPICLAILLGYVVGGLDGRVASPLVLLGFMTASIGYLAATVALGITVSTITRSSILAAVVMIGYYVVLSLLWVSTISPLLFQRVTGKAIVYTEPPADVLLFLLQRVTPRGSFAVVTNWVFNIANSSAYSNAVVLQSLPRYHTNALLVSDAFGQNTPIVLHEAGSLLVLAAWIIFPLVVALWVFERVDIP